MFDHISIGVSDLARARRFYDAALLPLGHTCRAQFDGMLGYGDEAGVSLWVAGVERPVPADTGSGLHLCFSAKARHAVDGFHAAAIASGGTDNGPPGPRPGYSPQYYAAFVIDPDGYRLEAHFQDAV